MDQQEKLSKIDHVTLQVADIESAVQWYRTSLSCRVLKQESTSALLQFENTKVLLVLPSQEPPHIAFEKEDAETYGELKTRKDGKRSTYVSDPAGNVVKLVCA